MVDAPATSTEAGFRPTPTQWAHLKIEPVEAKTFRTLHETDGKIAIDDDATPMFSPFSGRVMKLFAKAGDTVTAGAPLLIIEANEFRTRPKRSGHQSVGLVDRPRPAPPDASERAAAA